MTTQHNSQNAQEKGIRQEAASVISPRTWHRSPHGAASAAQTFQLFKPGTLRVTRHGVTIAPAGIAGLVLACVSITACRHAASHPLDDASRTDKVSSLVITPEASKHTVAKARAANAPARHAKAAVAKREPHARDAAGLNTLPEVSPDLSDATDIVAPAAASTIVDPAAMDEASFASAFPADTANDTAQVSNERSLTQAPPATTTMSIDVPLAKRWQSWAIWGAPAAATIALSAGLLAMIRRRRTSEAASPLPAGQTAIGWRGWRYTNTTPSRAEFFGAQHPELPRVWAVERVQLDNWSAPAVGASPVKPATDGRYGLLKPVKPQVVDLSLDDDAFLLWVETMGVSEPINAPTAARDESVTPALPVAESPVTTDDEPLRTTTEAAAENATYDSAPLSVEGVSVAPVATSRQDSTEQASLEPSRAEEAARAAEKAIAEQREAERQEALRREAAEREAEVRAKAEREAARQEAQRREAAEREAETRAKAEREAARQEAQRREAAEAASRRTAAMRLDAVADAKKQLTAGYPSKALDALAPVLADANASGEAWTVAGWSWWRMARDNAPRAAHAAAQAIAAFEHAIGAEPDRAAMLGSALIRCHLFIADHLHGQARAESLDAALQLMDNSASARQGDDKFVLERANALYERALLSGPEQRASQLDAAQQLLTNLSANEMDDNARSLLVTVWLAQANDAEGRAAEALLAHATDTLTHALHDATTPEARDGWLARLIDVELMRVRQLKSAARLMRLRQLRDTYQPKLSETRSILPLLSWIQLLREWAGMLSERPARDKLAEAEALFERIESLSPEDIGSVHFARAYYLRLRSAHESMGAALDTLAKADALLAKTQSPVLAAETVSLERAEVALAQARLLGEREKKDALERAVRYSDAALSTEDANLPRALACAITVRLAKAEMLAPSGEESRELVSLARRLLELAPHDPEALRLAAKCELANGDNAAAAHLCEAAWDAGCRDADLLRLWRESLTRMPRAFSHADNDPQWKRLNQCTRLAQSTGQAIR